MSTSVAQAASHLTPQQVQVYRDIFQMYDLDGDGVISAKELRKVSAKMGYRLTQQQIDEIMAAHDLDANGYLSFDEFIKAMPANMTNISEEEHHMADMRRKFQEFDQDGNGIVTFDEAHTILEKELCFNLEQSKELMTRYDKNGDGELSYEEFVRFYTKVRSKARQIKEMFNEFDKDNSGSISVDEAKLMLGKLGMTDAEVEALVAAHDTNNDGELQYDEFVSFLIHS